MKITQHSYPCSKGEIRLFRLENSRGAWVELSSLGAGITGVGVPDSKGVIENVALCYETPDLYLGDGPNMGKCPGRYANRIGHGRIEVGGKKYQLNCNLPPHHLHGGADGLQNQLWDAEVLEDGVRFSVTSPDGHENYPGNLKVTATYRWNDDMELSLEFEAESDAETVINLTNHAYWNLRGATAGTALDHELKMKASRYLETDHTLLPTGVSIPTSGNPMDFSEFKTIRCDINADFEPLKIGKGYDHCWVIDEWVPGRMSEEVVVIREPQSRRTLTIDSDQPGVQIYSGNWLTGSPKGPGGFEYSDYDGLAVEMQGFPDAPNRPEFPSQTLIPGKPYKRLINFKFGTY
ncbi:MAG: galactose mutarotase [Muribaculaceae bacterium]|nr:galactose mutarotase [Muribaculaceae bacterium]